MGNKLGHSGEATAAGEADRPPSGRHPVASSKKGKTGSLDGAQDDIVDEQVAEVPPPMEQMSRF